MTTTQINNKIEAFGRSIETRWGVMISKMIDKVQEKIDDLEELEERQNLTTNQEHKLLELQETMASLEEATELYLEGVVAEYRI